jgi:hypothetical protein
MAATALTTAINARLVALSPAEIPAAVITQPVGVLR